MSLRLPWRGWAIQPMRYSVRFTDIGHTGHCERQKYRDGDEDDRASGPEDARCAPAASSGVAVANERFSCGALTTHRRRERAGAAVVAATGPPSQ
jgi:hypothetical protein